jgi:hypothetical protein
MSWRRVLLHQDEPVDCIQGDALIHGCLSTLGSCGIPLDLGHCQAIAVPALPTKVEWLSLFEVTEDSDNVNDTLISQARDFDGKILREQWDKLLFFYGSAQKLAEAGAYWFKETDNIKAAAGEHLYNMDGYNYLDIAFLKDVDPAKQVSMNKTDLDLSAPGEKPMAHSNVDDCYFNLSDQTSRYFIAPLVLYDNAPSEYYRGVIENVMGIPFSWLQHGFQNLITSAHFMKPADIPDSAWVMMPTSAKQTVLKGYTKGKRTAIDISAINRDVKLFMARTPVGSTPGMLPQKGPVVAPRTRRVVIPPRAAQLREESSADPPNDNASHDNQDEVSRDHEEHQGGPAPNQFARGAMHNGPPSDDSDDDDDDEDDHDYDDEDYGHAGDQRDDQPPRRERQEPPPRREEHRPPRDDYPYRGQDDYDHHDGRHDDQAYDDQRGNGTEGKTLTFRDVQALPNYSGKRNGPRVTNYLADFEAALRLLSKRTLPTPGAEWGLLLKSKLEGDARLAIDALQASLSRVPTFQEMHDALSRQFAFSYEDVHSLTSKLENLSWDGSWTLGDYLTRFWSLSLRIADKRSNMDLVKTLKKALPRYIINQIESQFSTQEDPRLEDIIDYLKRTSWVNQQRESRGSQPATRGRFSDFGRRGRDSRGRARGGQASQATSVLLKTATRLRVRIVRATRTTAMGTAMTATLVTPTVVVLTVATQAAVTTTVASGPLMSPGTTPSAESGLVIIETALVVVVGRYHPLLLQCNLLLCRVQLRLTQWMLRISHQMLKNYTSRQRLLQE